MVATVLSNCQWIQIYIQPLLYSYVATMCTCSYMKKPALISYSAGINVHIFSEINDLNYVRIK